MPENNTGIMEDKDNKAGVDDMYSLFAKELAKVALKNPNQTSGLASKSFVGKYTQQQIYDYLRNPTSNEDNLRDASIYMYHVNPRYMRLIHYYDGLPTYAYVISPVNFNPDKVKKDSFKKQYKDVVNRLELMNIRSDARNQIRVAIREGAFYGVRWLDSASCFVQKLDPKMCQITAISDGVFLFDVDMSQIKESDLDHYPPEFEKMYADYKSSGEKYQRVDPDISVCVKADPSVLEYSVPLFAGVLPELYVINDTQALQEAADEIGNYKLITGEMGVDSDGKPILSYEQMLQYYRHIAQNIGDRVGLAIAPFKLDAIDFSHSAASDAIDNISRAVSNYWSTCGTSALLHGAENSTAGVSKLAIKQDETFVLSILDQCERQINRYLKTATKGTNKFKITFLRNTVFNNDDMIDVYKQAVNFGIGKSHYMAALGIPQYDIDGLTFIENQVIGIDDKLTILKTSSTQSSSDDSTPGRTSVDDTELSESGENTRENDTNANK